MIIANRCNSDTIIYSTIVFFLNNRNSSKNIINSSFIKLIFLLYYIKLNECFILYVSLNSLDISITFLSRLKEKLNWSYQRRNNATGIMLGLINITMLQNYKHKFRYIFTYYKIYIDIISIKTISCDTWLVIETRTCSCARIRRAWVILRYQLWVVLRSRISWFKMAMAGQHPPALENAVPRKARLQPSYGGAAEQIFLTKTGLWSCDRGPLSLTFRLTSVRVCEEEQRTAHSYYPG